MFRFHLIKDRRINFMSCYAKGSSESGTVTRASYVYPGDGDNSDLCAQLIYLMEAEMENKGPEHPSASGKSPEKQLDRMLNVLIGVDPHNQTGTHYVCVWGPKDSALSRLRRGMDYFGLEAKVKVGIKDFRVMPRPTSTVNMMTEEVEISELSNDHDGIEGVQLHCSGVWNRSLWKPNNVNEGSDFTGVITISCLACRKTSSDLVDIFSLIEAKPHINQKMLKEGVGSDVTIIGSGGEEVNCHKFFLKGESDVFEAMFNPASNSLESTTGIIKMKDMSFKSVQAFLAFLYLDDLEGVKKDSAVALDLLKAAHKYNVKRLEKRMRQVLLMKPVEWFNAEMAIELFLFARKIPGGETLVGKAIVALKSDHCNLWDSPSYKELFIENPVAAMELCKYLATKGPVAGSSAG